VIIRRIQYFLLIYLLIQGLNDLNALNEQKIKSSEKKSRVKVLPLPTIGYEPETNLYFGGVCLFLFTERKDSIRANSNFQVEFTYTLNDQIITALEWDK